MMVHGRHARSMTARRVRVLAVMMVVVLIIAGGVATQGFYTAQASESDEPDSYSVTDSRNEVHDSLQDVDEDADYVTVVVDDESRIVVGDDLTTVRDVLQTAGITLGPDDVVSPGLDDPADDTVTIDCADSELETSEETIPYSTITRQTDELTEGEKQVQTEGVDGVMETTSLVTRVGDTVVSSHVFASLVETEPVDEVILVGTAEQEEEESIGETTPSGEMQQWAHDYLIDNGYTEEDFTATVYIISRESGWRVDATNASSGAYGLPQALPGSKMASAGSDWETNYQTQLKWFWSYCENRYGSITGAYEYWLAHGSY